MGREATKTGRENLEPSDGGAEGLPRDPQALETKRHEQEKIERAAVAIRSFRHDRKVFDVRSDIAYVGMDLDYIMSHFDENMSSVKERFRAVKDSIIQILSTVQTILVANGDTSKRGELTLDGAKQCIQDLQQLRVNLLAQKQGLGEIRDEFSAFYKGNYFMWVRLSKPFDDSLMNIDTIADKLQSRIEVVIGIPARLPTAVNPIVAVLCKGSRIIAVENNLTSAVAVRGNRLTFTSALSNILTNAVFFAKQKQEEAASVNVRLTEENGFVRIDIADNGPGIPADLLEIDPLMNRPKLFNLNVSQREGGTGLGTTEAWYAIKDAGGTIEVASELGKGTTFTIRLPVAQYIQPEPISGSGINAPRNCL